MNHNNHWLFIILIKSSVLSRFQSFKLWLTSPINSSWLVFYFWSVLSAMNIDYCDRKYWTYIFLLIYLWRDHQIQLGHFLELFKAMNIDYCDQRLENAAYPSVKRSQIHLGLFPVGLHSLRHSISLHMSLWSRKIQTKFRYVIKFMNQSIKLPSHWNIENLLQDISEKWVLTILRNRL